MAGEQEYIFSAAEGPRIKLVSPDGLVTKELHLENDGKLNLEANGPIQVGGTNGILVAFTDGIYPYISYVGDEYAVMAHLIFEGTDALGVPSSIKIVSATTNASKAYDVRIVRADTGDVIAEITGQTNTVFETKDMGALSNLPTGETIFEVQGKAVWNATVRLASMSIKF
jgi:hypothetical protein